MTEEIRPVSVQKVAAILRKAKIPSGSVVSQAVGWTVHVTAYGTVYALAQRVLTEAGVVMQTNPNLPRDIICTGIK